MTEQAELSNLGGLDLVLKLRSVGVPISVIARRVGVSRQTIYKWLEKTKVGEPQTPPTGFDTSETNRKMPSAFYQSPTSTETNNAST